jgi:hypothetical protein
LLAGAQNEGWNRRKRIALVCLVTSVTGLFLCVLLRFVPRMNYLLAGRPAYMQWIAAQVAASLAAQEHWQSPVIVAGETKEDCRMIPNATSFDDQGIFFVVTYTEHSHSFCIGEYALSSSADDINAITLDESSGRNYGAALHTPVRVVPVGHVFKVLPDFVVSLMDWRTKLPSSGGSVAFNSQTEASFAGPVSNIGLNLNSLEIRAAGARKHERINLILDGVLAGLVLMMFASVELSRRTYQAFCRNCAAYNCRVSVWRYVRSDLDELMFRARQEHEFTIGRIHVQARAEESARRDHEELRQRLEAFLEIITDEAQRQEIVQSRQLDDHEQMARLLHDLESRPKTPEERLASLLEPTKEFCSADDFLRHHAEALEVLRALGFRSAREFVVRLHEELRAEARKIEQRNAASEDISRKPN